MEESDNTTCFICEEDLECDDGKRTATVTREKELLKKVSEDRSDGRIRALLNFESIKVHEQ